MVKRSSGSRSKRSSMTNRRRPKRRPSQRLNSKKSPVAKFLAIIKKYQGRLTNLIIDITEDRLSGLPDPVQYAVLGLVSIFGVAGTVHLIRVTFIDRIRKELNTRYPGKFSPNQTQEPVIIHPVPLYGGPEG